MNTTKHILMVMTSHDQLGDTGEKTGFWVEEFAAPYYAFIDAGYQVTIASPAGGQPPIDPKSRLDDFKTAATNRFDEDEATQTILSNTIKLENVSAESFDSVFYPGGHGPLWDLANNSQSIDLIESFLKQEKPVAAVCHATAVLLNVKNENGNYAVAGKATSGFTNSEEEAVALTDVVPFLVEDELIQRGSDYQKGEDWMPFAIKDGLIITGQNPASSELVAQKLMASLKG
mgnify:CR=1 FL=1